MAESRTINAGFYGVGLPHLGVEALIAMTNKLLMHYGCNMAMGKLMKKLYSLLFVEVGLSFQPLQESYDCYGYLATHLWIKMLWEKLSKFDMKLIVADFNQSYPCKNNQFIMQVLIRSGYLNNTLRQLNRVRISLQLLFMSDILTALGNKIDSNTLFHCLSGKARLTLQWLNEQPTKSDCNLWTNAMHLICPSRSRTATIGHFITNTHRIWRWAWNEHTSTLHRLNADGVTEDVFVSGKKPNRFHHSHNQLCGNHNMICSVESTLEGEHYCLTSTEPVYSPNSVPALFLEVLNSWGNTRLWEHMSITSGVAWLKKSIADSTLVAVTEGLYIRELFPNLCSAAFVLECSKGRGKMVGRLLESIRMASAYRGELLGLMAIHLIILSINKMN
jgi:hypothetical protein